MSRFTGLFLLLTLALQAGAQIQKKYKENGDLLMQQGDVNGAAAYYRKAMDIDSTDLSILYAYGLALERANDYDKAVYYFDKISCQDRKRQYALSRFHLAEMYKCLGEYPKALKEYGYFLKRYKGDKLAFEPQKARYEIDHYHWLSRLLHDTIDVEVSNSFQVNTVHSEFSGFFESDSSLLFSSLRSESSRKGLVEDTGAYYSRIYRSLDSNGWQQGVMHASMDTDEKTDLANAVLTPQRDYVYYSECHTGNCKIYRAINHDGEWTDFQALPEKINLPRTNNSQPIIARVDGYDMLYFVSDRQDGYGKLDIWSCIAYSNGLYGDVINLGDSVNSPGNDICPFFMVEEDALYFSSDWYFGLGAFDIFRCQRTEGQFHGPENLGVPVNSSYNDLYFRYDNQKAVITSNRVGSLTDKHRHCCNDLYFLSYEPKLIPAVAEMTDIEKIQRLLPVKLYFDNDEPNPGSHDTSTNIIYSASNIQYVQREGLYQREYARGLRKEEKVQAESDMEQFFENEISQGYRDLKEVFGYLLNELEKGSTVVLDIKGFASPLSDADYNRRLTLRRIASIENEFRHYQQGVFEPYLEEGKLVLRQFPFGEDQSATDVSDDLADKRNAVYSKKAAVERRVEIIAVEVE